MANECFIIRKNCPACLSNHSKILYEADFDKPPVSNYLNSFYSPVGGIEFEYLRGAKYVLAKCEHCSLIFQKEIGNDDLLKRLYERWIDPEKISNINEKKYTLQYYIDYAQEVIQLIAYFKKPSSALKFFDFGMGWGKWCLMAKAFGCDAYGSELSEARKQYARLNGIKVIEWDEIPGQDFDFINTEQVFEHIAEPLATLQHLKKGLAPDGIIKISVPTANNINTRLKIMDWKSAKFTKRSLNPVAPLEHINFYQRKSLRIMGAKVGLKEIFLPTIHQYRYSCAWGRSNFIKNVFNPIERNIFKRRNYALFRIAPTVQSFH